MKGAIEKANELKETIPGSFIPNQFNNPDNVRAHVGTTAKEIIQDLGDLKPNYLVLSFGSGGTITGLGRALKKAYPMLKVVAVEPEESPLLSKGYSAPHRIQGIGANFIPGILDTSIIDEIITVKGEDAIEYAIKGAQDYGTFIGISSGANLKASLDVASRDSEATIITLFPDTGERYLSSIKV